jgi:hypothetical protein
MSGISIEDRVHENERQITELLNEVATLRARVDELSQEYYE